MINTEERVEQGLALMREVTAAADLEYIEEQLQNAWGVRLTPDGYRVLLYSGGGWRVPETVEVEIDLEVRTVTTDEGTYA